ncbi:MAG: FtsX-like permease family protein [Candidatus Acidiferrum sp.]
MKFARIILANLLRSKARLLLTTGSFAVALFLFAFLGVVKVAFRFWEDNAVADRLIVVNRASYFYSIPLSYKDKILRIPGIKFITYSSWFIGVYQNGKDPFGGLAISTEGQRQVYPEFQIADDQWQAFLQDRQGAIAGVKAAEHFHWKIGDRIPFTETSNGTGVWELNLVGIYHGKNPQDDENQFWLRWDYRNEKVPTYMKGKVGWYVIRVDNPANSVRIARAIDQEFTNSPYETKTQVESTFAADMMKQFTNIQTLILLVGAVVFFTLILVTGNTMAIAVRERTGELAVCRAIGFSDLTVLMLVIAESLIIALIGSALGLGVAVVAIPAIAKLLSGLLPNVALSPQIAISGLALALIVGAFSGLIPGLAVARMRVINGLRRL